MLRDTQSPGFRARVREYYHMRGLEALERAAVICERRRVGCRKELETGNVVKLLSERAGRADLLVMGAYADCTAESLSLGSTTEYLMRNSPVPVLVHH